MEMNNEINIKRHQSFITGAQMTQSKWEKWLFAELSYCITF